MIPKVSVQVLTMGSSELFIIAHRAEQVLKEFAYTSLSLFFPYETSGVLVNVRNDQKMKDAL